ncbi:hypothetical protein MA16_Dca020080 [Dendrobium catenatum]|uniref:Uncharacterized protein n=1 Tax=Dendrobium catenatum TaxID=906689 RepID=A0A2I0XJN3_9ASPA|nr:hypothetical protein MA16_Dca014216 [Dendrobium catenatum]PKU88109.1 hypothetical protein MA16_Dca020080 [Dendrobium catenatum]
MAYPPQFHMALSSPPASSPPNLPLPTMPEIIDSSRSQGLCLRLHTLGPFFRVTAEGLTGTELGKAEGFIHPWFGGKVLHLDSIRMKRETLAMKRSIFGLGLFVGAVAIRHGFDCGCRRAELLAINDTPAFHSRVRRDRNFFRSEFRRTPSVLIGKYFQLVRFYTRMGFRAVHEVDGSSMVDLAHMLVWGGRGTRMDADIENLLRKWSKRLKS